MTRSKISDENLLELYRQGLTNRKIATELQVSQAAVHYRLQKLGLTNNCHKEQVIDPKQVAQLHEMGLTNVGIALLLSTNVVTVSQQLKTLGLTDNYCRLKKTIVSKLEKCIEWRG